MIKILFWLTLIIFGIFLVLISLFPPFNPFAIYILLFGFLLLPIVALIFSAQKTLCLIFSKTDNTDSLSKLISFGIITCLFINTFASFVRAIIDFSIAFISNLSNNFTQIWQEVYSVCDSYFYEENYHSNLENYFRYLSDFFARDCFAQIFTGVIKALTLTINNSYRESGIIYLPFGSLILAIAIWILLVRVIEKARQTLTTDNQSPNWLSIIYTNPVRDNVLFFLILGIGLYLSIASIAAIPSLQDSSIAPESVSIERFKEVVNNYVTQFNQRFPEETNRFDRLRQNDPFKPILIAIRSNESESSDEKPDESNANPAKEANSISVSLTSSMIQPAIDEQSDNQIIKNYFDFHRIIKNYFNVQEQRRKNLIDDGQNMFSLLRNEVSTKAKAAETTYEVSSTTRKGSRETLEHFLHLTTWFNDYVSDIEIEMNSCIGSIDKFDRIARKLSDIVRFDLLKGKEIKRYSDDYYLSFNAVKKGLRAALGNCDSNKLTPTPPLPTRPALGSYLGPFTFVASWLLITESLPLSLITGLVGFGLLGSACSSFVRERIEKTSADKNEPLVKDLAKVVVIGLSAAILAFLAVMGGLAVFFTTVSEPNPYALLLGCLIAAVFGEDVWRWAKDSLQKRIDQE